VASPGRRAGHDAASEPGTEQLDETECPRLILPDTARYPSLHIDNFLHRQVFLHAILVDVKTLPSVAEKAGERSGVAAFEL
jgi:hypothetical protein